MNRYDQHTQQSSPLMTPYAQFFAEMYADFLMMGDFVLLETTEIPEQPYSEAIFASSTCLLRFSQHQSNGYTQIAAKPQDHCPPRWAEMSVIATYLENRPVDLERSFQIADSLQSCKHSEVEIERLSAEQLRPFFKQIIEFFALEGFDERWSAFQTDCKRRGVEVQRQLEEMRNRRAPEREHTTQES